VPNTFVNGEVADADEINANFTVITDALDVTVPNSLCSPQRCSRYSARIGGFSAASISTSESEGPSCSKLIRHRSTATSGKPGMKVVSYFFGG
jgi:hypothetical protein